MFRVKIQVKGCAGFCAIVVVATLFILSAGCGSSSNTLSQAQAQAVTQEISLALDQALSGAIAANAVSEKGGHPSLATIVSKIHSDQSPCTVTATGENCNFPISDSVACSGGGTISVAGDVVGTLNTSGGGTIQTQITVTPASCAVSNSNLVINGDPSVSVDSQVSFTQSAIAYPITFAETGGISYGPKPSGSCQINVTSTINSATSCTITGTVCGRSVSGSC
jgi:hypothetical protein